jgi:Uma2 family endonuclease
MLRVRKKRKAQSRIATQRPGVELSSGDYRPEPDVGVIDADYEASQRLVDRADLLAEVVSDIDAVRVPETDKNLIDVKRNIYLSHPACEAVLIIEQDRIEVRVDVNTDKGWVTKMLGPADDLRLPGFGLRRAVLDLYQGTPLCPRPRRQHTV